MGKNNFLGNFNLTGNQKWNFQSFFYGKQTFLVPKSIILTGARVSENWHSAADNWKWPNLGIELTTFIDGIISELLFQWGKKRFNLNWFFIWRKMKKYNLIYSILKSLYFHNFCRVCCLGKREKKSSHMHFCNLEYVWLWLPGFPIQGSDFKSSGWLQGWLSLSSFQGW